MSWWVAGATVVSSVISSQSAKKGQAAQEQGIERAIQQFGDTYSEQKGFIDPYYRAGTDVGLKGLTALSSPDVQADFYRNYYQSPQFAAQSGAAQNQQLAASEATGGLQSTSTQNQLARIAPTLGLQALQNQQNLYGNLANIGQRATGQLVTAGGQYGANVADLYAQQGAVQAGGAKSQGGIFGGLASGLGGIADSVFG